MADSRVNTRDVHLRFTSTATGGIGMNVINTAVSRAKKRLVVICDREFWIDQKGELIGKMAREADECIEYRYEE